MAWTGIPKIKLEIDTDPPAGFETESRTVLLPTPFAVRVYRRPDLFAGKMHAILCRKWQSRVMCLPLLSRHKRKFWPRSYQAELLALFFLQPGSLSSPQTELRPQQVLSFSRGRSELPVSQLACRQD